VNQVYSVDIVMSTGEGKTRQEDSRVTIFKRNPETSYSLKMKSARNLLNEIKKKYTTLPFNLRSMEDTRSRLGIVELLNHNLVHQYPVLWERNGEYIAQFKFTVLILRAATQRINEGFALPWVSSEFKVESDPVLAQIMATGTRNNKKKKEKEGKTTPTTPTKSRSTPHCDK